MALVKVSGEKELNMYALGKVFRFDENSMCLMDDSEFNMLKPKYPYLAIVSVIKPPEPETEVKIVIPKPKKASVAKRTPAKRK